ncbi:MAG: rhomboid family intramembrane serine protease [Bacteroidota bacterium]
MNLKLTEVVKNLLIINALVFFGTRMWTPIWDANGYALDLGHIWLSLFMPGSDYFRPFQLVTHMFMHADFQHLFFNMLLLYFFGPPLEALFGSKRFLIYYLICGFGALALHLGVSAVEISYFGGNPNIRMLGASGAIMGIVAGFGLKFPNQPVSLLFLPIQFKAIYMALGLISIDVLMGLGTFNSNVAHFAHLGGAITGFLMIEYWGKFGNKF